MLKNEIKRAFSSKGMKLSVIISIIITIIYMVWLFKTKLEREELFNELITYNVMAENSPFDVWLIGYISKYFVIYYYLLPILVVLPYAASYGRENSMGYLKNIFSRMDRTKYKFYKMIAVFLSGGVAGIVLPVISLMMAFTYMPYRHPTPSSTGPLALPSTALGFFYYDHPFLYSFVYILCIFMFAGAIGLCALLISEFSTNYFTVMLTPFMIIMFLNSVLIEDKGIYRPDYFLCPRHSGDMLYLSVLIPLVIIIMVYIFMIKLNCEKDAL